MLRFPKSISAALLSMATLREKVGVAGGLCNAGFHQFPAMNLHRVLLGAAAAFFATAFSASALSISSTFDTGLDGWGISGSGFLVNYVATGGNPGGFARYDDGANFPDMFAVAPAAFLGNLSAYDGGTFSFDAKFVSAAGSITNPVTAFGTVEISNGSSTVSQDIAPVVPGSNWQTFSGSFDAAAFGTTPTIWSSILANVTSFTMQVDAYKPVVNGPRVGIDNVTLAVPEPSTGVLLVAGAGALAMRRRKTPARTA
jgi:PEP-CTERM motif